MSGTVGSQGPAPGTTDAAPLEPVLLPGTDPVLLARLYPEQVAAGETMATLEAAAMEAGHAVKEAGALNEASQQEPVAGAPDAPAPPGQAPVNTAVPAVTQTGSTLNCTMGEWTGEPTSYAYAWQIDGVSAGTNSSSYDATSDVGKTATCTVTATNAAGSTAAPPSTGLVVA
jgi:hypothetical protein